MRALRANVGLATVTSAILAVGIGANAAVFGVFYRLSLRELPFPDAHELVEVQTRYTAFSGEWTSLASIQTLQDVAAQARLLDVAYSSRLAATTWNGETASALRGAAVSADFFAVYGVAPALGRYIGPADTNAKSDPVVVLSFSCWQEVFGGDRSIIGRTIHVGLLPDLMLPPTAVPRRPFTVVGVMPDRHIFPIDEDLWIPTRGSAFTGAGGMGFSPRMLRNATGVGRIKGGASLAQVQNELHLVGRDIAVANPLSDRDWDLTARSLREVRASSFRAALSLLLIGVAGLLVLTCVNVSSLFVARGRRRHAESAIRQALGATKRRIYQQCLCESLVLAGVGGVVGVLVAAGAVRVAAAVAPATDAFLYDMSVDWAVLGYVSLVSLATGIVTGLVPAANRSAVHLWGTLNASGAGRTPSAPLTSPVTGRGVLIGLQLALAAPLVVGTALAAQSLNRLVNVDLGLRFEGVTALTVGPSPDQCETVEDCAATVGEILESVTATQGVTEAGIVGNALFQPPLMVSSFLEASELAPGRPVLARQHVVSATYFRMLNIRLLRGRGFEPGDRAGAPLVAIVSDKLATEKFGGDALGKYLRLGQSRPGGGRLIVGQVADVRDLSPTQPPVATVYVPLAQAPQMPHATLLYRSREAGHAVQASVKDAVLQVDRGATLNDLQTLDAVVAEQRAVPVFQVYLLATLAIVAMLIALAGVYGLISYNLSSRVSELGLRAAIGATPRQIVRGVIAESVPVITYGLLAGGALSLAFWRVFRRFLFEAGPTDVLAVGVALAAIAVCAVVAYYIPSRSASKADPIKCLRNT